MTINEIAKLAGVSASTVSKIINNKAKSIPPTTQQRVLEIVKKYNYTPYGMIKSSLQSKTFSIALLCTFFDNDQLLAGIVQEAQNHGYCVLIFNSQNNLQLELRHINTICQKHVDGVLWEPVCPESISYKHYLTECNISINYFNNYFQNDAYNIDYIQMGYALTQKLIDYKHKQIACLLMPDSYCSQLVFEGFRKCLFDNQVSFNEQLKYFTNEGDYHLRLISSNITGVVSSHFSASLDLCNQLSRLHYSIPSDFSLVSLKKDSSDMYVHISGIEIPYRKFGIFIVQRLIEKCENKKNTDTNTVFSPEYQFTDELSIDYPAALRRKKIIVVGSINIDNTFNVDSLPQFGKTTRILNTSMTLGGKGANQAVGASRLGCEVVLISTVGNDLDSILALNTLRNEKLSENGIFRIMDTQTGKAYINISKDGESSITILSGANAFLTKECILRRRHLFENVGYCLLSTEISEDAILIAAKICKDFGAKNIIKPTTLKQLPCELIPYIDILIPNKKEADLLCSMYTSVREQADFFFHLGIPVVIITLGSEGCYLRTETMSRHFPAIPTAAVDTTGGADAFIAALASYLLEGFSLENAIQIAICAASFCIERQGVIPALVDRSTLETYVNKVNPNILKNNKGFEF